MRKKTVIQQNPPAITPQLHRQILLYAANDVEPAWTPSERQNKTGYDIFLKLKQQKNIWKAIIRMWINMYHLDWDDHPALYRTYV